MPRSGTKLLRDLLNRHPLVGIPEAETELLPDWAMRWPSFGDLEQPRCWAAFVEHARQSAYFVYLEEERGIAIDPAGWRLACPDFSLAGVFEGLCRLHGGAPLSGVWGDKSPGYLHHLPLIFTLFPRARVIHIVRDPRDQVQSAFKAWHKDRLRSAARWSEGIIAARDALKDTGRSSMVVRYEDLVASPAVVLKKICTLLEITFDPAMLQLGRPSENLGDTKGQTTVVAGNVEKWRQTMEPELQKRVQALCAEGLRAHGYPCTHEGPQHTLARTERQLRQVMDGINMIRFDLGARGVFGSIRFRWRLFSESGRWE
ncbi:MAG: hypothetical protein CL927_14165 [Deltaproteobacteria bacterium]|nr:hypothetical protein [Deltaproteobacteria bacterium]